jgi:hypothetical protein
MAKERESVRVNLREYGHAFSESYTAVARSSSQVCGIDTKLRTQRSQNRYRAWELADARCHVEFSAAEVVTTAAASTERRECCLLAKIDIRGQSRYKINR